MHPEDERSRPKAASEVTAATDTSVTDPAVSAAHNAPIDPLASAAYKFGTSPLDWALFLTQTAITAHLRVIVARGSNRAAFPLYCIPLTVDALACRIVGELLDAGWRAPNVVTVADG